MLVIPLSLKPIKSSFLFHHNQVIISRSKSRALTVSSITLSRRHFSSSTFKVRDKNLLSTIIIFYDPSVNQINYKFENSNVLSTKILERYYNVILIDVHQLLKIGPLYLKSCLDTKPLRSIKVIINLHSVVKNEISYIIVKEKPYPLSELIRVLNTFETDFLDVLSLMCFCRLTTFIKHFNSKARIISMNSTGSYFLYDQLNINYRTDFYDYLYHDDFSFDKIIVLYHLNNHFNTDNIIRISNSSNLTFDIKTLISKLSSKDLEDLKLNKFIRKLIYFNIIKKPILDTLTLENSKDFTCFYRDIKANIKHSDYKLKIKELYSKHYYFPVFETDFINNEVISLMYESNLVERNNLTVNPSLLFNSDTNNVQHENSPYCAYLKALVLAKYFNL